MTNSLVFIDTNIFLDFYRAKGRDGKLSILDLIDANHDRIITGEQVEMEYKNHRQDCIIEAMKSLRMPDFSALQAPALLKEAQPTRMIENHRKALKKQVDRISGRLQKALLDPSGHDIVYQCLQRLFQASRCYHLTRAKKIRNRIRALARKRFILGYPPRKRADTSCGDAVNWEWLIYCASEITSEKRSVIIVSRDTDYGCCLDDDKPVLNDWLVHEFKERVSRKRKVLLTTRLTDGFKIAGITVTPEQIKEEDSMIADREAAEETRQETIGPGQSTMTAKDLTARIQEIKRKIKELQALRESRSRAEDKPGKA